MNLVLYARRTNLNVGLDLYAIPRQIGRWSMATLLSSDFLGENIN